MENQDLRYCPGRLWGTNGPLQLKKLFQSTKSKQQQAITRLQYHIDKQFYITPGIV